MSPHQPLRLTGRGAVRLVEAAQRIVVVGASGWIGLACLEMLASVLGSQFQERVICFGSEARTLSLRDGTPVRQYALEALADLPAAPTLLLSLAFLTLEKLRTMTREDYLGINRRISTLVRDALDPIGATAVFLPSSGAAYGADIAAADARQVYGALKLEQEALFEAWVLAGARSLSIARVFNISGPYINKLSDYALSAFIMDALRGQPIQIRAQHRVMRSYVGVQELLGVVFALLTEGEEGAVRFDTAGVVALEVGEVARVVEQVTGSRAGIHRGTVGNGAADVYVGDGKLFAQVRERHGVEEVPFVRQVEETTLYLSGLVSVA